MNKPIEHLERNWDALGKQDPMWAILCDAGKKGNRWDPEQFFFTGVVAVRDLMDYVHALGPALARGRALDFGCGIGRLTQALALYFDHVDGIDIAPSMIELAKRFNARGTSCEYLHNPAGDLRLFPDETFDFVLTELVLQHLSRDLMFDYLGEFVRVLKPDGIAVFDVPRGLSWTPKAIAIRALPAWLIDWLRRRTHGDGVMEIHTTRRKDVIAFLRNQPVDLLDNRPLSYLDPGLKRHQYCLRKTTTSSCRTAGGGSR